MATFTGSFTCSDKTGTLYFKIRYRLMGDTTWMSFNIPTSGTTYSFTGSNNLIYEAQVVNVNGGDNPAGNIVQGCVFTDPAPVISYTNTSVGLSFSNLSYDVDTYTTTIAQFDTPGSIIATHILPAGVYPNTIIDTFTGLDPLTKYYITITPAANQFTETFTYIFTTESVATCAAPQNTTATLTS